MRYPGFVAEMALPANRPKLRYSVRSGYALAALFGLLAIAGPLLHLVPFRWAFYVLVVAKLLTNTLTWISLRADRLVLEASGLNVLTDVLCMTGAIYWTGGLLSPLLAIYGIEITVLALLSNRGVTVMVAVLIMLLYGTMAVLVHVGLLPAVPPPASDHAVVTTPYVVTGLAFVAIVVGVPTFFTASILHLLGEKERALARRTQELVEAGRQKSQFMANVTHELRTPIHGICGLSDLVETGVYGPVTEQQRDAQAEIKRSAKSLLGLIDDLLALTRADAGRMELKPAEVDLGELLPTLVATTRSVLGTRAVELELDLVEELPVVVTDRAKLAQIVLNLLTNAVKFTPDGGRVVLRGRAIEGGVTIAVEDTGIGIAEKDLGRVFEPFYQGDGSAEREQGGVGLGLALVKRLAELLDADVRVTSEPGAGSTFTLTLPRSAQVSRRGL